MSGEDEPRRPRHATAVSWTVHDARDVSAVPRLASSPAASDDLGLVGARRRRRRAGSSTRTGDAPRRRLGRPDRQSRLGRRDLASSVAGRPPATRSLPAGGSRARHAAWGRRWHIGDGSGRPAARQPSTHARRSHHQEQEADIDRHSHLRCEHLRWATDTGPADLRPSVIGRRATTETRTCRATSIARPNDALAPPAREPGVRRIRRLRRRGRRRPCCPRGGSGCGRRGRRGPWSRPGSPCGCTGPWRRRAWPA